MKEANRESALEEAVKDIQDEESSSAAVQEKASSSGLTYIRWGHNLCPKGAELLYSGVMAGSHYSTPSGGSNFQCLPSKPEYALPYRRGGQGYSWIFGTEYYGSMVGKSSHNVPCAQCYVPTRIAKFMNPGAASCPKGWTREYYGYLMSVRIWKHHEYSTFECVDKDQLSIPGSKGWDRYKSFLTYVEGHCGGNPCPPFVQEKELNCVVCTK